MFEHKILFSSFHVLSICKIENVEVCTDIFLHNLNTDFEIISKEDETKVQKETYMKNGSVIICSVP